MKKILYVILLTIGSTMFGQVREELNYYPLHVGDEWQYKITYHSVTYQENTFYMSKKVLNDTTFSDGTKYFVVEQPKFVHWKFSAPEKIYTRIDTTTGVVFERNPLSEKELKVDSIYCAQGIIGGIGFKKKFFAVPFEEKVFDVTLKCRRLDSPIVSEGEHIHVFHALSIGIYRQSYSYDWIGSEGNSYTLVYAKINGKEYGTYVSVEDEETIPSKFSLSQNYPNPFNPETTISYKVQAASKVSLKVYDLLGREVLILVNEFKQPGNYKVRFNVETRHGVSLQSGVYFYRLQAGSFSETKKMILLK